MLRRLLKAVAQALSIALVAPRRRAPGRMRAVDEALRLVLALRRTRDFRPIAAQRIASGKGHSGLILVPASRPRNKASTRSLADAIERVIEANPGGLAGSERWI
jgi:hypothetical protein